MDIHELLPRSSNFLPQTSVTAIRGWVMAVGYQHFPLHMLWYAALGSAHAVHLDMWTPLLPQGQTRPQEFH